MSNKVSLARRAFMQRMGQLSVAGVATPWALNLAAMGEAAAFTAGNDYKALVCVFLYGGNDNGNTLIPIDATSYADYAVARGTVAIDAAALGATTLAPTAPLADGRQYALAPGLGPLKALFDSGELAVQLNVGTLIQPTTMAQFKARSVPLPPKLYSHNDQQSIWQSSRPEGAISGWGGRLGDLALSSNGATSSLFTCMSVTGNAVYLSGTNALSYQIGSSGPVKVNNPGYGDAVRTLIAESRIHAMENEYNQITARSMAAESMVSTALASGQDVSSYFPADDSGNYLANQLKMVARLISARAALGVKRQVFLVSMGGFDTHDNLTKNHPVLMARLGTAMGSFQAAMKALGVSPNVTTFTASEFGRTLGPNGDGSDHGWGSHHFVMGGAVNGKALYGTPPTTRLREGEDVGSRGVLLPTTSVDQFAATMATWFGVSSSELPGVIPNIGNFPTKNLGFMKA